MNSCLSLSESVKGHLSAAVHEGVFPGAVLVATRGGRVVCSAWAGSKSLEPAAGAVTVDTVFDLASLTKPLATGVALMKLVDDGRLDLDEPLGDILGSSAPGMEKATPRMALAHCAGFAGWLPFYHSLRLLKPAERRSSLRKLLRMLPAVYEPGEKCLYSDPGYMLLEWIVEKRSGLSLSEFSAGHYRTLGLKRTFLGTEARPGELTEADFAATERCRWRGKVLRGDVHDENAHVLDGWSGHSGLFGTAREVCLIAEYIMDHYRGVREDWISSRTARAFLDRGSSPCPGTRVLAWDVPSVENSSSGRFFSSNTVGHLGFTGTSLWMDLERESVVVLLTNRVHPTRDNDKIRIFRPFIHDEVMKGMGLSG